LPQDVLDIAPDVLAHRLVLSYDAIADGVPAEHAVRRVLETVALPQVAPRQRAGGPAPAPGYPGQTNSAQGYPGPSMPGQAFPGQPHPDQPYPGVPAPGPVSYGPPNQQRSA
jgi:MoxR-like ATPase